MEANAAGQAERKAARDQMLQERAEKKAAAEARKAERMEKEAQQRAENRAEMLAAKEAGDAELALKIQARMESPIFCRIFYFIQWRRCS